MSEPIGFIGLGLLGLPMATNLLDAGHALRVFNRTASKADALVARGAARAASPADAATPGGIVVTSLWDAASVEEVASDELLERLGPGGVHVSTSTILPAAARELAARHARHGVSFVEAPIFGRPEAAVARQLWLPIAGPQLAKDRVRPVLVALGAQGVFDFGEAAGSANVVKIAGNFLIGSATRSLGEALAMAGGQGVDVHAVVHMLTTTLFTAPIYQSYGKRIADGGPALGGSAIILKDLALFTATAGQSHTPAPIAAMLLELLAAK
jgi:3-hydroxyisobutyrate dehydrogenase-like beta-hydroxyacid dehydrogenase